MEIIFKKSFIKNLQLAPKYIQDNVEKIIIVLQTAKNLESSKLEIKRMEGQKKNENYYRIKVADWRIGINYIKPDIVVMIILPRGKIYKHFPPK